MRFGCFVLAMWAAAFTTTASAESSREANLERIERIKAAPSFEAVFELYRIDAPSFEALKIWVQGLTAEERALHYRRLADGRFVEIEPCWEANTKGKLRAMVEAIESSNLDEARNRWDNAETVLARTSALDRKMVADAEAEYPAPGLERNIAVRFALDQAWRKPQSEPGYDDWPEIAWITLPRLCEVDKSNISWLKYVRSFDFMNEISDESLRRLIILVIHADTETDLQKNFLRVLLERDLPPAIMSSVAGLSDRIAVAEGRNQDYGTQFELVSGGCFAVRNIDSISAVDRRRARLKLPSLTEYADNLAKNTGAIVCEGLVSH
jgi:hypothetical protein